MFAFIGKLIKYLLTFLVVLITFAMLFSIADAWDQGTRDIASLIWRGMKIFASDIWETGGRFFYECSENLTKLVENAQYDTSFNPIRWSIGSLLCVIFAGFKTIGWWLNHCSTAEFLAYLFGAPVMSLLIISQLGNIGLSSGGGGGGGHH